MATDDEFVEELKQRGVPKGYSRYAVDYLQSAGIDPRTVDIEAEYDSSLTDTENAKEFARKFPVGGVKNHTKGEVADIEDRSQEYAEKAYFEERRKGGYEPNHKQIPGSQLNDEYRWKRKKKEGGIDENDMPAEPQNKPNIIDNLMGRYNQFKSEGQKRAEAQRKERLYKASEKSRQLEADIQVRRAEAKVKQMERVRGGYEREDRAQRFAPLNSIRDTVRGFGGGFRGGQEREDRYGQYGPSNAQRLMFGGGSGGGLDRFGSGGNSRTFNMLMGQPDQPKRRHRYVTIVQGNRTVQVDLNNPAVTGQGAQGYPPPAQGPSMIERLSVGGGNGRSRMMAAETRHERSLISRLSGGNGRGKPNRLTQLLFNGGK